jgi:pilus assembly protein FimV
MVHVRRRDASRSGRYGTVALGLAVSASWAGHLMAVGLGPIAQQSSLGQSLRIVIPVSASAGEEIAPECFKLVTAERDADGVPQLAFARVGLEQTAAGAMLVVTNTRPVNDPALRVTIQAGCDTAVRREYVLLLDPPPVETPLVAADAAPAGDAVAEAPQVAVPPPPAAAPRRPPRGALRGGARTASGTPGEAAEPAQKAAPAKPRSAGKAAPKRAAPARSGAPRLTVSSGAPSIRRGAAADESAEAAQARANQELANAIEAETVVLKQRIVELTAMVDRMQQEVRASEIAQRAADEAARAPPPKVPTWWEANGTLASAVVGLPLLVALGLLWKRRKQAERTADWQAAGAVSPFPEPVPEAVGEPTLRNPAAGVVASAQPIAPPPPRPPARRAPVPRGGSALAVSELLQVTEEARVYVALGHPERAIDVLSEHIRHEPRAIPAAWLMLLDLYRASDRRQEFRKLAEEFHQRCNVHTPLWEDFDAAGPEEGGLETFPHILRRIVESWRAPDCRAYLEGLLFDNREGRRIGFPLAAYGDILLLLEIHDAPPVVDIDSDLARDGRLGRSPKPAQPRPVALELDLGNPGDEAPTKPPA